MTEEEGYRGPTVPRANETVRSTRPTSRGDVTHAQGFGGRRSLYDALGYDETSKLTFESYWGRYQRDGLATALVDRFVDSTWQSPPIATPGPNDEGEAAVDETSDFSESVAELFGGGALQQPFGSGLRRSIAEAVELADIYATVGEFSLLFLGFADGGDDERSLSDPLDENSLSGGSIGDAIAYVTPVSQAQVSDMDDVTDRTDPRFGLPEHYDIQFENEGSAQDVHHSRVIHLPEGTRTSATHGTPVFLKGWNRFDDIEKLLGGSAEQAWRGAYNGMAVQPPRDADGNMMTFDDDGSKLEKQVDEYRHNMRRVITSTGEIEMLEPNIADVSNHIEMHFRAISAAYDIPQSIYMGNETGERATTEDRSQWAETISGRRNYAEQRIVRPLIDRLDYVGAIDAPDTYTISWTSLTELSEQEWAELLQTKSQAIDLISAGQPDVLFSEQERRKILGYPPERGSMTETSADDESGEDQAPDPAAGIDEEQAVGFGDQQPGGDNRE